MTLGLDNSKLIPEKLMIFIALVQGLLLLLLDQAIEFRFWPGLAPQWLFCFYTFALTLPTLLLLSLEQGNGRRLLQAAVSFSLVAAALGYYVGYQAIPLTHIKFAPLLMAMVPSFIVATFKAAMYIQQFSRGESFNYPALFQHSWRNAFTLALSGLFALCVWGLLMLWAALFKAIEINLFKDLFTEPWFFYPALALANGLGIVMFRKLTQVIATLTSLLHTLIKFLLPFIIFVALLFLTALPFTGLDSLWKNGGSGLVIWLQTLILFFTNCVYQDDVNNRPYQNWLHRFIYVGIAALPIYSAISAYGLYLRIDQYGWSVDRLWAVFLCTLLAMFSIAYSVAIVRRRDNWLSQLATINVVMGIVVMSTLLLVNSPLLDFRKIAAADQIARINNGSTSLEETDINYFRRTLARPGYLALQQLKADHPDNTVLQFKIDSAYREAELEITPEDLQSKLTAIDCEVPPTLLDKLLNDANKNRYRFHQIPNLYIIQVELNRTPQTEFVLIKKGERYRALEVYYEKNGAWQMKYLTSHEPTYDELPPNFYKSLMAEDVKTLEPEWLDIQIGDYVFSVD